MPELCRSSALPFRPVQPIPQQLRPNEQFVVSGGVLLWPFGMLVVASGGLARAKPGPRPLQATTSPPEGHKGTTPEPTKADARIISSFLACSMRGRPLVTDCPVPGGTPGTPPGSAPKARSLTKVSSRHPGNANVGGETSVPTLALVVWSREGVPGVPTTRSW
jgi:hypothetical protein